MIYVMMDDLHEGGVGAIKIVKKDEQEFKDEVLRYVLDNQDSSYIELFVIDYEKEETSSYKL